MVVKKEDGEEDDDDVEWEDVFVVGIYVDMFNVLFFVFWKIKNFGFVCL